MITINQYKSLIILHRSVSVSSILLRGRLAVLRTVDLPEVALAPAGDKAEMAFTSSLMSFLNREMLIVVKPERREREKIKGRERERQRERKDRGDKGDRR
jgi:hypothetical protein